MKKVRIAKSRLVSGSSILYTLLLRKYTMGFCNWLKRNRIKNGVAIGVNPYSDDWDKIAEAHGYHSQDQSLARSDAGDYKGFDKEAVHYTWVRAVGEIMGRFYDDHGSDNHRIRWALLDEIAFSRHVCEGHILEWVGSNTSGNSITTPLNSLINLMLARYGVTRSKMLQDGTSGMVAFELALYEMFNPEEPMVVATTFGDDILMSLMCDPSVYPWFTPANFANSLFSGLGIVYTGEDKEAAGENLRHITELSFLKRGFRPNGLLEANRWRYLAPLELDSILDSIRWMQYDVDGNAKMHWATNVASMMGELSLHTPEIYKEVGDKIIRACHGVEEAPHILPRILRPQALMQMEVMSREYEF